jgi:hypothetical protein
MRLAAVIILAASLSGCSSWFSRSKAPSPESVLASLTPPPAPSAVPAHALDGWPTVPPLSSAASFLEAAAKAKTEAEFARSVELARESARLAKEERDASANRARLAASVSEVTRLASWAMGLGFAIFLGSSVPFLAPWLGSLRKAAGLTVALGAAVATLAPWLADFLGHEKVLLAGYAAFAILALAASLAAGWYILDAVRDAARKSR